jgi:hypothetical protein
MRVDKTNTKKNKQKNEGFEKESQNDEKFDQSQQYD